MSDPTMKQAEKLLQSTFNFPTFRPGQRAVITALLTPRTPTTPTAGRSLAIFPTAAGKSLCYQLPSLLFPTGLTLVVSPLIALMKDQVDSLLRNNHPAACLDSSLTASETRQLFQKLRHRQINLLFVSPERFKNDRFIRLIRSLSISLFAVDEAHCISEWGHSFRPDYLRLARWASRLNCDRRLALTATATPPVERDICLALDIPPQAVVRTTPHRPNLTTRLTPLPPSSTFHDRISLLASRIRERSPGPTIVYVTLQSTASHVATLLRDAGFQDVHAYHAGLAVECRKRVQDHFMSNTNHAIVVATIAFGMGMDHPGVRYVYHLNLPKSLEGYIQEIGRAGRDGLQSICETIACVEDVPVLERFIYGETPSRADVRALLHTLFHNAVEKDYIQYSTYDLAFKHDIRDTCLGQILAQLDLSEHLLEESTPFFAMLDCRLPNDRTKVPDPASNAARVLQTGVRKTSFVYINVIQAAEQLNVRYGEISRICDDMLQQGFLTDVKARKLTHRAYVKNMPQDLNATAGRLYARLLRSQKRELKRLKDVLKFFSAQECHTRYLARYLGNVVEDDGLPCGHCEFCLGGGVNRVRIAQEDLERVERKLDEKRWAVVMDESSLPKENALLVARFAAGISSPVIARKYKKLPSFGSMSDHGFKTLLSAAVKECGSVD